MTIPTVPDSPLRQQPLRGQRSSLLETHEGTRLTRRSHPATLRRARRRPVPYTDSYEDGPPVEGVSLLELSLECPGAGTLRRSETAGVDAWAAAQARALDIVGQCVRHYMRGRDVFYVGLANYFASFFWLQMTRCAINSRFSHGRSFHVTES